MNRNQKKDEQQLSVLAAAIQKLADTTSGTEKLQILRETLSEHRDLYRLFVAALDPNRQYHMTHKKAINIEPVGIGVVSGLLDLLDKCDKRKISGNVAKMQWCQLIKDLPPELGIIAGRILDKDLKCGVNATTVNKIFRELDIPEIKLPEPALGTAWKGQMVWVDTVDWYASRKFDGVRCMAHLDGGGNVKLMSRSDKPFATMRVLEQALSVYRGQPIILDGELAIRNKKGNDDFQALMHQLRRKKHQIKNIVFHVFDMIPTKLMVFSARQERLRDVVTSLRSDIVLPVEQVKVTSEEQFAAMWKYADDHGWEGLILRKDDYHKPGRSSDIFKVKRMKDMECVVDQIHTGPFTVVMDGKHVEEDIMTAVSVKYKKSFIGVGSGWTLAQRRRYKKHPEEILGKTITVQYFSETKSKNGDHGLRFPVVKCVHGDEREY